MPHYYAHNRVSLPAQGTKALPKTTAQYGASSISAYAGNTSVTQATHEFEED